MVVSTRVMKMMKWLCIAVLLSFSMLVHASGPTLPRQYRLPTEDELAADWRLGVENKYATVVADFNDDKLVDGCFLAVDQKLNKLVLLVVLVGYDHGRDKWILLETMNSDALQYMGVERVDPSTVMVYPSNGDDTKMPRELKNQAIKLFASEGSSSIFYWDDKAKKFSRLWISK
jgi:hypothetical protein